MTINTEEQDRELRRRLIPYIVDGLSLETQEMIGDAVGSLVNHPEVANHILEIICDASEHWCQQIAREVIGIPDYEEWSIEELLDMLEGFGCDDETQVDDHSEVNWEREGF